MRINHRQIEAFRSVILAGSVTSASRLMGVSQPAVSRLIHDLQGNIGMTLFEKRGSGLEPTAAAIAFYTEVERSFVGLDRIKQSAQKIRDSRSGSLRIAALPALINGYLPRFAGDYLATRPHLYLSLMGVISPMVVDMVLNNQCDLGFTESPMSSAGLTSIRLPPVPRVVVVPSGHRLAAQDSIRIRDLDGEDFISLSGSATGRAAIDLSLDVHQVKVNIRADTPLSEIACGFVSSGLGVAICDPFTAAAFAHRGIEARPLTPRLDFVFDAIFPPSRAPLPVALDFVQSLSERIRQEYPDAGPTDGAQAGTT
ncbi:LysR substrate-binding domain-containing protein [Paracoccus sp. CPCC 101403]|uniref:LysR substrate-binding domain-containing protein n=2 Tax=Paracoccus broussonetiae TaxID=3075834 RepID=A0ABU3EA04_9RHOB|nr:LysR substrate-binding domain-containing protein [Paracoccus sp. CPCC 101403]MDT1060970.1 LysR substrate-binding domain-containing protein [Paracoccus sp. CPCC 101403]